MKREQILSGFLLLMLLAAGVAAQQDKSKGGIKGKLRGSDDSSLADATVIVRQNDREVTRATTGHKGEFIINGLTPGIYNLTFRKQGWSTSTLGNIEVIAGKVHEINDRLILRADAGSFAFVRGSVFDSNGYSVRNVRIELTRLEADGKEKKIDTGYTTESGQFSFRLPPSDATYRVTMKEDKAEPASKEVKVEGAVVYRVALTFVPKQK